MMRNLAALAVLGLMMGLLAPGVAAEPRPAVSDVGEGYAQSVAVDSRGFSLVVWVSDPFGDAQAHLIRLDPDGVPTGAATLLTPDGQFAGSATDVVVDGEDRFLVVHVHYDGTTDTDTLSAQRVAADGTVGPPITVHTAEAIDDAALTTRADGTATVGFVELGQTDSMVLARTISAAGIVSPPLTIVDTQDEVFDVDVAVDGAGRAAIVWTQSDLVDPTVVWVARIGGSGQVTPPLSLSDPADEVFDPPQVVVAGDGVATVVWGGFNGEPTVVRARVTPDGLAGPPDVLKEGGVAPMVALDRLDRVVVAWRVYSGSNSIEVVRLSQGGTASPIVQAGGFGNGSESIAIDMALDGLDRPTVVWTDGDGITNRVLAVRLSENLVPGRVATLSTADRNGVGSRVASGAQGQATAIWTHTDDATEPGTVQAARLHTPVFDAFGCLDDVSVQSLGVRPETPIAIPDDDPAGAEVELPVAIPGVVLDVDVVVDISHPFASDLDILLRAPNGAEVVLSTDNGAFRDDVFEGTTFDDQAIGPVTDATFVDGETVLHVQPEGALARFVGEPSFGVWTLQVVDDASDDVGMINGVELVVTTVPERPTTIRGGATQVLDPPAPIADAGTTTFTQQVSGLAPVAWDVDLVTDIAHTWNGDLDIMLVSPEGTRVTISTDNGGANDDVFAGTIWTDGLPVLVTDAVYADGVVQGSLVPEGAMAAFVGEDPNGEWTLEIVDDVADDTGTLNSWALDIESVCPAPVTPPGGGGGGGGGGGLATGADIAAGLSGPVEATVDEPFTVDFAVSSAGPDNALGTQLSLLVPDQVTVGADLPDNCALDGDTLTCDAFIVEPGETETFTIPLTAIEAGALALEVTADSSSPDPDEDDNTASITIDVVGPAAVPVADFTDQDIIDEAIEASMLRFPSAGFAQADRTADFAVLARADVFADALGGSVLLGDAPLLFTASDALDPRTAAEIDRLGVDTVYLLGGTAALDGAVADTLVDGGQTPVRLAGDSRIETAVAVAERAIGLGLTDGTEVGLARAFGEGTAGWADSVSGGGWAASTGTPILLTPTDSLHPAVQTFLTVRSTTETVVLGGVAAIDDGVAAAVPGPRRVSGPNRFATATAIARTLLEVTPDQAVRGYHVIDGTAEAGWSYGLIAAGLVADSGQPILLTAAATPPETLAEVVGCGDQVTLTPLGDLSIAELQDADAAAC